MRPGYTRMMDDAKDGVINTIIVKDFSRLGRDYIGVADYVERIFPLLGVRFISVNNHFDSGSATGASMDLGMAIENLINTFYLQDTVRKRRAADETRWKQGKATVAHCPFGYFWNKQEKGKWNLDPVSSKYVRYIFDLALEGNRTSEIAKVLNEEAIPTPNVYNIQRMEERTPEEQSLMWPALPFRAPKEEQFWTSQAVCKILQRYEYTGALIMNKKKKVKSPETGKYICHYLPESEHIVAEGAHEAIVTVEEFEKAQEVIVTYGNRKGGTKRQYPLRSKVRCGTCRRMLRYTPRKSGGPGRFDCTNKYLSKGLSDCCNESYEENELNAIVLNAIERVIAVAQVLEVKLEGTDPGENGPEGDRVREVNRLETQIRVMKEERIRQYEGYADGMITRAEYLAKKQKIDDKITKLEAELEEAEAVLAEEQRIVDEIKKISRANLTGEEQADVADGVAPEKHKPHILTRALVEAFIDVIYVYDPDHIEIVFTCEDVMKAAIDRTSNGGGSPDSDGEDPAGAEPSEL